VSRKSSTCWPAAELFEDDGLILQLAFEQADDVHFDVGVDGLALSVPLGFDRLHVADQNNARRRDQVAVREHHGGCRHSDIRGKQHAQYESESLKRRLEDRTFHQANLLYEISSTHAQRARGQSFVGQTNRRPMKRGEVEST
jgi:hypothetical protein